MRRRIETTIGQLTEQFHVSRVRALKHWGLLTRMSNTQLTGLEVF